MKRRRSFSAKTSPYKKKRRNTPYGRPEWKKKSYAMYKSPRHVMPQEYVTNLTYTTTGVLNSVGALLSSVKYRTEAFDVDPALGSTAMPGFTELASIYARYRTLAISYKIHYSNNEVFPLQILAGFSNSSISTGTLTSNFAGNPTFQSRIAGPIGGTCTGTVKGYTTIVAFSGTKQPLYDDVFTGSTTSATLGTAGTVYANFGIISTLPVLSAGCAIDVRITLTIQFDRSNFMGQ